MTTKQPCPECVETISDWLRATAFSVTSEMVRDHFLPKSPAQQLAAECPHGMTVEQAQWVLDRLEQERKDECSTIPNLTKPTTDTDYVAVPRDVLGAACYIIRKSEHAESKTAETLREYALATPTDPALHTKIATSAEIIALLDDPEINNAVRISGDNNQVPQGISETAYRQWLADGGESGLGGPENFQAELDKDVADPAPRYVFGPAIRVTELPANTEYRLTGTEAVYKFSVINQGWRVPTSLCRAYRIGQSHPHDGGECPLADGSARVYSTLDDGSTYQGPASERQHCWPSVVSFIPIDEGKGS